MFEEWVAALEENLKESNPSYDEKELVELVVKSALKQADSRENESVAALRESNDAFTQRNRERWGLGLRRLHSLRQTAIEAAQNFQHQFLAIEGLETDPLLGVQMRIHANACRITGEIIHLLEGGYPDGAIARWRTLYEMVVTSLVLKKHGREAATDYIKHGMLKNHEGMLEYQKTAEQMGLPPFSEEELRVEKELIDSFTDGEKHWHWARKYTGYAKLEKLREYVGMDGWSHNYKLASRNIHSDYYEIGNLLAMSETETDILLVG